MNTQATMELIGKAYEFNEGEKELFRRIKQLLLEVSESGETDSIPVSFRGGTRKEMILTVRLL